MKKLLSLILLCGLFPACFAEKCGCSRPRQTQVRPHASHPKESKPTESKVTTSEVPTEQQQTNSQIEVQK